MAQFATNDAMFATNYCLHLLEEHLNRVHKQARRKPNPFLHSPDSVTPFFSCFVPMYVLKLRVSFGNCIVEKPLKTLLAVYVTRTFITPFTGLYPEPDQSTPYCDSDQGGSNCNVSGFIQEIPSSNIGHGAPDQFFHCLIQSLQTNAAIPPLHSSLVDIWLGFVSWQGHEMFSSVQLPTGSVAHPVQSAPASALVAEACTDSDFHPVPGFTVLTNQRRASPL
jgi:hypothetical protein